jgi:pyruvate dehydrogenase E1 component alpha subunit
MAERSTEEATVIVHQVEAQTALKMLRDILRIRRIEERIRDLYAGQEMRCPTHFSIGQEAVAVGVCAHLERKELVTSAHRSHAHYLAKGGNLKAMIAELYGKATGCATGKGGSMHLVDLQAGFLGAVPLVGSTIAIGVGAALQSVLRGEPRLTAVFFGDVATETGTFHESLNFAAIHKLPVIMICENNLYSVLTPFEWRKPAEREIYELAQGHRVFTRQGDGNDADVVSTMAAEAIEHARGGEGPAFLEFKTYRWLEHCGPMDDLYLKYRSKEEFDSWVARDPLKRYADRLRERGIISDAELDTMEKEISAEIDEAVAFAKSSPFPSRDQLTSQIYAP